MKALRSLAALVLLFLLMGVPIGVAIRILGGPPQLDLTRHAAGALERLRNRSAGRAAVPGAAGGSSAAGAPGAGSGLSGAAPGAAGGPGRAEGASGAGSAGPAGPITEEGPIEEMAGSGRGETVYYGTRSRPDGAGGEAGSSGSGGSGREGSGRDASGGRGARSAAARPAAKPSAYAPAQEGGSGNRNPGGMRTRLKTADDLGAAHQALKRADHDGSHAVRMGKTRWLIDGVKDHAGKQFDGNFKVYNGMALQISSGTLNETRIKAIEAPR